MYRGLQSNKTDKRPGKAAYGIACPCDMVIGHDYHATRRSPNVLPSSLQECRGDAGGQTQGDTTRRAEFSGLSGLSSGSYIHSHPSLIKSRGYPLEATRVFCKAMIRKDIPVRPKNGRPQTIGLDTEVWCFWSRFVHKDIHSFCGFFDAITSTALSVRARGVARVRVFLRPC
jgi:hypothetical protein